MGSDSCYRRDVDKDLGMGERTFRKGTIGRMGESRDCRATDDPAGDTMNSLENDLKKLAKKHGYEVRFGMVMGDTTTTDEGTVSLDIRSFTFTKTTKSDQTFDDIPFLGEMVREILDPLRAEGETWK